jgi:hypothetical protein
MTNAPERIWAGIPLDGQIKKGTLYEWTTAEDLAESQSASEVEIELGCDDPVVYIEYVRADTHAAALAENEALRTAERATYIKGLENAVETLRSMKATANVLHQGTIGLEGTIGLAASALSITITKVRAALASVPERKE